MLHFNKLGTGQGYTLKLTDNGISTLLLLLSNMGGYPAYLLQVLQARCRIFQPRPCSIQNAALLYMIGLSFDFTSTLLEGLVQGIIKKTEIAHNLLVMHTLCCGLS